MPSYIDCMTIGGHGDGLTPEDAIITTAIGMLGGKPGVVRLPSPLCLIQNQIVVPSGVRLKGWGEGVDWHGILGIGVTDQRGPTTVLWGGSGNVSMFLFPAGTVNAGLSDFSIDGRVPYNEISSSQLIAISARGCMGLNFERMTICNVGFGWNGNPSSTDQHPLSRVVLRDVSVFKCRQAFVYNGYFHPVVDMSVGVSGVTGYNLMAWDFREFGWNFAQSCDSNNIYGLFALTPHNDAFVIGINTSSPTTDVGASPSIIRGAVMTTYGATGTVLCNNTGSTRFTVECSFPAVDPVIRHGGLLNWQKPYL